MSIMIRSLANSVLLQHWDGYLPVDAQRKQRFSIAHQIGHHLAGHTLCPEESAQTFSTSASNAIEIQANNFALALLIPGEHLRYAVLIANQCDLKELALIFGVSTVALHKRLQQIQLI